MKLLGMLDSPFVRRTAIGLSELGISFERESLSVFSDYERFKTLNPLVKAPTLLLDDGSFLVDSNLIIQYAERLAGQSLYSTDPHIFALQQHIIGVASIANEKTVQFHYEQENRPKEKRHQPWLDRVQEQLNQTYQLLEKTLTEHAELFDATQFSHASIATSVAWFFTQHMHPELIDPATFPALTSWSNTCEETRPFKRFPYDFSMSPE